MRRFILPFTLFSIVSLGHLPAEQLPEVRPALFKPGPDSLVNLIDTAKLMKEGQGDAVVRFTCGVSDHGEGRLHTYRSSPGSTLLAEEAVRECPRARFIPAVYNHETVPAAITGTIIFVVNNGKPHLRIFLNQEEEHLKKGDDFIAPEQVFPWNVSRNSSVYFHAQNGSCRIQMQTDATGNILHSTLVSESPVGNHMGDAYMFYLQSCRCTPGYLNGQPIACTTTKQFVHRSSGGQQWSDSQ